MANALGRISGQLLKDNLTRNGTDLKFDEFGSTDPLLTLNVTNRYVGINSDVTLRPLSVVGKTVTGNLISLTGLQGVSNLKLSVSGNTIVSTQDLNFFAATQVNANIIDSDNIRVDGNVISTTTLNTALEFAPSGSLDIYNNLNVTGNLWARETVPSSNKGNITLDGSITFGSIDQSVANADTVIFAADINSDINPNVDELYSIGSPLQKWEGLYTALINGAEVSSTNITSGDVDLASRQGKIWYVSTNGVDTNVGDHQNGTFATIKHALEEATNGDTVFIYPGTYTEITPLIIPVGVAVRGAGIRSVTIVPNATTDSETVFLMNGETTVSDLTVKDFYSPGYAFAFAPNFTVSSRSPYIQNITVITRGSVTSASDPRGFDQGDAGRGALVDGSLATALSKEASMLFHSVTFITPGVDALVMTNGVRVEWLNSFSYFANRGMYATNGTLGLASLGIRFGAEIRSIGSANVYGNIGAEAVGASTLMYLITHNFAYIGAGKDVTNDPSLNIAANETIELDNGKIYYQSLDNKGNFNVGDAFGVSFETGQVKINGVSVSAGGLTSINFASGTDETVIDATQVVANNIKFSSNLLTTLFGAINLDSGTNQINLNANTDVTDNLNITGNFNIDGKLTIGNAFIDIVRFTAPVEFDLRPISDNDYTLGGPTNKSWDVVYLDTSYIGNYQLENATISTIVTDTDIELRANGSGKIYIPTNNVEVDNNLTVNGISNFGDNATTLAITVTGTIDHTGLLDRTGDTTQTGTYIQDGYLDVSSDVQIADVKFIDNTISTVTANSNLQLGAASTGNVTVPSADVQIDNNLYVTGNIQTSSVEITNSIVTDSYSNGNINISLDVITTTVTDSDLELRAAGTGKIYASQDNVKFDQILTVDGVTALKTTNVTGDIIQVGDYLQIGNTLQTGNRDISLTLDVDSHAYFDSMSFVNNTITTTDTNADLSLTAAGSGIVYINDNATIDQNLRVNSETYTNGITNSGIIASDTFSNNDIEISTNTITTTVGNNNLRLLAAGNGIIYVPTNSVEFNLDLTVLNTTSLKNTIIGTVLLPADIDHVGDYNQTGSTLQTGNRDITGTLDVTTDIYFDNINIVDNKIFTTTLNSDIELAAIGSGIVEFNDNLRIVNDLEVGILILNGFGNSSIITSDIFTNNTIKIVDNKISTEVTNNNLVLSSNGTGIVQTSLTDVTINQLLDVADTTNLKNTTISGLVDIIGDYNQTGSTLQTGNRDITGTLDVTTDIYFDNINIVDNKIFTTNLNDNLQLKAAGTTGIVIFNEITEFRQTALFGTLESNGLSNSGTITSDIFTTSDIEINDNYITTTLVNNDLTLIPNGTGNVSLPLDPLVIAQDLTVENTASLAITNINGTLTHIGNTNQLGNITHTGNFDLSNNLTVTGTDAFFTNVRIINNRIATSLGNTNLELRANGSGNINITDTASLGQNLTVNGITTTANVSAITRTITSDIFLNNDIEINDNYITTTIGNNNLILTANGLGGPTLEKLKFNSNTISTESNNDSIIISIPAGNLIFDASTALKIPVGSTVNRPVLTQGELRFNSTENLFRGFSSATVTFAGIYSADRLTRVLAHPTNNTVNFTTNNNLSMTVSSTGFTVNALAVDDLFFNNNIISSTAINSNITLDANGSGSIKIGNIAVENNEFLNLHPTDPLILQNTGAGYVKFSGTYGLTIPTGDNSSRPLAPETGDLRYNTDLSEAEVFNGINYQALSGSGGDVLSAEEVQEITNIYALVLG